MRGRFRYVCLLALAQCASSPPSAYRIVLEGGKDGSSSLTCYIVAGQPLLSVAEDKQGLLEVAIPEVGNEGNIALAFSSTTKSKILPRIFGGIQIKTGEVTVGEKGVGP